MSRLRSALILMAASLLMTALTGCSKDESAEAIVNTQIEHLTGQSLMRVTWTVSTPVNGLIFTRPNYFREGDWKPLFANQRVERRGSREILISTARTTKFSVSIPTDPIGVAADYPFLSSFSHGGVVLYTGHLRASPLYCNSDCGAREVDEQVNRRTDVYVQLVASPGHSSIAGEQRGSSIKFKDELAGRFVYMGPGAPIQRAGVSMLIDPALPAWVQLEVETKLPEILDLNTRRLKQPLPFQPIVYVPYKRVARKSSASYAGAVVASEMLISLNGERWARRAFEEQEEILKLLAHESFHFWNASLASSVDRPGGRWLHEGSADAFAYLTLYELGYIDAERFTSLQTEALNRCMVGLTNTDLPGSDRVFASRNFYECGAVIQFMLMTSLEPTRSTLWRFWSKLLTPARGGFYTHEEFFRLVARSTNSSSLIDRMKDLTEGRVKGTDASQSQLENYFMSAFQTVGISLSTESSEWPAWYPRLIAEKAISLAVQADCNGAGYLAASYGDEAHLIGSASCRNLKNDADVIRVGNHSLWSEGVDVYDSIRRSCSYRSTISLATSRASAVSLACPRLPERPMFIRVNSPRPPLIAVGEETDDEEPSELQ